MSSALQVALFLACVAVVLFVLLLIPLSILLYRRARSVARQLEELNADLKELIQDSRTMVQNISLLSAHANEQLDELDKVIGTVRGLSERANHVAEEISDVIEAPVLKVARSLKTLRQIWRLIAGVFGEDSRRADHRIKKNNELKK
jgi:uncharacterized protein YoxC